mmetsp:Transcript_34047/g.101135  ORF Transcript_34047/g.101135 Transcript_34047/m.101135 type:complete len:269 (+) Transcript_34047:110-916(+)
MASRSLGDPAYPPRPPSAPARDRGRGPARSAEGPPPAGLPVRVSAAALAEEARLRPVGVAELVQALQAAAGLELLVGAGVALVDRAAHVRRDAGLGRRLDLAHRVVVALELTVHGVAVHFVCHLLQDIILAALANDLVHAQRPWCRRIPAAGLAAVDQHRAVALGAAGVGQLPEGGDKVVDLLVGTLLVPLALHLMGHWVNLAAIFSVSRPGRKLLPPLAVRALLLHEAAVRVGLQGRVAPVDRHAVLLRTRRALGVGRRRGDGLGHC